MSSEQYFTENPASKYQPKQITVMLNGEIVAVDTAAGVFSPTRLDAGTKVLLDSIEGAPSSGEILDLGCGWGPISLALARQSPKATVWAVDTNRRSLDLTEHNANKNGLKNIKTALPVEVDEKLMFSGIWSNPPIRVGKEELHNLLLRWLPRLSPGGDAYLVVKKDLGADSLQRWLEATLPKEFQTIRFDNAKGYRVLRVQRKS